MSVDRILQERPAVNGPLLFPIADEWRTGGLAALRGMTDRLTAAVARAKPGGAYRGTLEAFERAHRAAAEAFEASWRAEVDPEARPLAQALAEAQARCAELEAALQPQAPRPEDDLTRLLRGARLSGWRPYAVAQADDTITLRLAPTDHPPDPRGRWARDRAMDVWKMLLAEALGRVVP